jgi:hypothetical protein
VVGLWAVLGRVPSKLGHRGGAAPGEQILRGLEARFAPEHAADAPYLFAELADTSETDEQAAIDAGQIQPVGIRYTATRT